jgi:hypothetical protein
MKYRSERDDDNPYMRPARSTTTAVMLTSVHTGGTIIALTRECRAELAHLTGTRYAPIDGGPGYDGNGWAELGYCYKQEPERPIADDGTGYGQKRRPFDKAFADFRRGCEQSMRQLKADIADMLTLESLAKTNPRRQRAYQDKAADFVERYGRQWFALAADYLPEMIEGREHQDG